MSRVNCECGHAFLLPSGRKSVACPRCGKIVGGDLPAATHSAAEISVADLTPTELGTPTISPDEPPKVVLVDRAPVRLDYATDRRATPPDQSSLEDPYEATVARGSFLDWVLPFLNLRAAIISLMMLFPMGFLGLGFVIAHAWGGSLSDDSIPVQIFAYAIAWPSILFFWIVDAGSAGPGSAGGMIAAFFTIQFLYFYAICLAIACWFRRI